MTWVSTVKEMVDLIPGISFDSLCNDVQSGWIDEGRLNPSQDMEDTASGWWRGIKIVKQ